MLSSCSSFNYSRVPCIVFVMTTMYKRILKSADTVCTFEMATWYASYDNTKTLDEYLCYATQTGYKFLDNRFVSPV